MQRASMSNRVPKTSDLVVSGLARHAAINALLGKWADEGKQIRPPHEVFQEKYQPIQEALRQALESIARGSPCDGNNAYENREERMLQITDQMRELESQYTATVKEEELAFLQQLEEHHNRFFAAIQDILGQLTARTETGIVKPRLLVDAQTATVTRSDPRPETAMPSSAGETADIPVSTAEVTMAGLDDQPEEEHEARQATDPGDERHTEPAPQPVSDSHLKERSHSDSEHASPCHPEPQPANHSRTEHQPANSSDINNQSESPSHSGHARASQSHPDPQSSSSPLSDLRSESVQHPDSPHTLHSDSDPPQAIRPHPDAQPLASPAHRKRSINEPAEQGEPAKRPRKGDLPVLAENEASIEFDQVFQEGNAKIKYQIARYPPKDGRWYILECKEHGQHFDKDPLIGASKHLSGASHGNLPRKRDIAVRLLGTVVLNCTDELANQNNLVARESFAKGLGYPPGSQSARPRDEDTTKVNGLTPVRRRISHPQTRDASHARRTQAIAPKVLDPKPGEIYVVYWKKEKAYYAVMILPWRRFTQLGMTEALLETGLLNDVPPCYVFNKKTDHMARGWASGYQDGGHLVPKRQFPVIYFDKNKFPEKSSVGWVCVGDLRHFDAQDVEVQHKRDVMEFLEKNQTRDRASRADDKGNGEQVDHGSSPGQHKPEGSTKEKQVSQSPPTTDQEQPIAEKGPPSLISISSDDDIDDNEKDGDEFGEGEAEKDSDYHQEEEDEDEDEDEEDHDEGQVKGGGRSRIAEVGLAGGVQDGQEQDEAMKDAIDQGAGLEKSRNDIQETPYEHASGPDDSGRNHAGPGDETRKVDENHVIIDAGPDWKTIPNESLGFDDREAEGGQGIAKGQEIENGQDTMRSQELGGAREMESSPNTENNLFFDYDPIWRQDDVANGHPGTPGFTSPSETHSFVAELLQNREQAIELASRTSDGAIAAPVTTALSGTCNPATEEPSQVDTHVSAEQPQEKQVQGESSGAGRCAILPATIAAALATTNPATHPNMPVLRPMDNSLLKTQSCIIPPTLMPKDDNLAMIAAQAVMSSLPKAVLGGLPTQPRGETRGMRGLAAGASNAKPAGSQSQHAANPYLSTNTQKPRPLLPARRGSDFFDAVLGPRAETLPPTGTAGSQAALASTAQQGTSGDATESPRPNVKMTQSPRLYSTGSWNAYTAR
ncbi:hypothetical protein ACJ41O_006230 [Fusarium nematophilum]